MRKQRFGELFAHVTGGLDGNGSGDGPLVVLLHGFGAPGDDLVDLAAMLGLPRAVRFVFPEAPLSLASVGYGEGRAWWMLDLEAMERRARGEHIDRSQEVPPGLVTARRQLAEFLAELRSALAVSHDSMILGGFSQGAMLACDVTLHEPKAPAGLVLLSGTLLAQPLWEPLMPARAGLPILQSHGRTDSLLPFVDAESLRDLWRQAGADLTFVAFPGGHELPPVVLEALSRFIAKHLT